MCGLFWFCSLHRRYGPFFRHITLIVRLLIIRQMMLSLVAQALGNNKAVLLRSHGPLTVGQSVDSAAFWFITMERSCQSQLLAEAAGIVNPIDEKNAKLTAGQVGREIDGWENFQPLWEKIVSEQPDLLD